MRCLVLLLLFGSAFAQPVHGPFVVDNTNSRIADLETCVRGDTVDAVWIEDRLIRWQRFNTVSNEVIADPVTCASLRDWPQHTLHSLIARAETDWACIVFQDERVDWNQPNSAKQHASVLCSNRLGQLVALDSGYTTMHYPRQGDGNHGGYQLTLDATGRLYASWLSEYFLTFDASVYTHAAWLGAGDSVYESQIGYSGNFWFDPRNQAFLNVQSGSRVRSVTGEFEYGLVTCYFDSLDDWEGGCIGNEQSLNAGICFDFGFLDQDHGLAIWAVDDYDSLPRIASVVFNDTTPYNATDLGELGLESLSSTAFHPNFGFAALQVIPGYILLARIDTAGHEVHPPGVLYITDGTSFIVDADVTISDSGEVIAVWSEYTDWNEGPHVLKIAWTDWTTFLNTEEQSSPVIPTDLSLSSYPNPFNSTVTIQYDLPQAGRVELSIFDLQGRLVETLHNDFTPSGSHSLSWSPNNLASGVYFARLNASAVLATSKLLYLK